MPVVFKIAEAIRLSGDGFHLVVKAFGDTVGASEAPHARNLLGPGVEGVGECEKLGETGLAEISDGLEESRNQLLALPAGFVFLQQQVAEPLFETVDDVQRRSLGEVGEKAELLFRLEVVAMATPSTTSVRGAWSRSDRYRASRPGSGG